MPDLRHTLVNYDLDLLKIIAGKWGLDLIGVTQDEIIDEMVQQLADPLLFRATCELIPDEQKNCLSVLTGEGGKLPWHKFVRIYGNIREMGVARREREMPFNNPISIAESLWYHGLIGRAFLNLDEILQEYVYIPDEFLALIPGGNESTVLVPASAARRHEYRVVYPADDHILDHLTSFLAAIRSGRDLEILKNEFKQPSIQECQAILFCSGLIDQKGALNPEAIKDFLARPRSEALSSLCTNWLTSAAFNELKLMPGIISEGVWKNDPLKTRQILVGQLKSLDGDQWWNIDGFVSQIKQTQPDFQRPTGDYESWTIRSSKTGSHLHGYEHWGEVDGALIRYLINSPLHWLGFMDLGGSRKGCPPEAFRFSRMSNSLFSGRAPEGLLEETGQLTILRNGQITCPRKISRATRYQLARFSEWLGINDKGYQYQLTADSLQNAVRQGLQIEQLLTLLTRHTSSNLPKSLVTSLQRWGKSGTQVLLKRVVILQVAGPEVMTEIRNSPIGRFLGDAFNPTMVKLSPAAAEKIIPRLLELGYFCEVEDGLLSIHVNKD